MKVQIWPNSKLNKNILPFPSRISSRTDHLSAATHPCNIFLCSLKQCPSFCLSGDPLARSCHLSCVMWSTWQPKLPWAGQDCQVGATHGTGQLKAILWVSKQRVRFARRQFLETESEEIGSGCGLRERKLGMLVNTLAKTQLREISKRGDVAWRRWGGLYGKAWLQACSVLTYAAQKGWAPLPACAWSYSVVYRLCAAAHETYVFLNPWCRLSPGTRSPVYDHLCSMAGWMLMLWAPCVLMPMVRQALPLQNPTMNNRRAVVRIWGVSAISSRQQTLENRLL